MTKCEANRSASATTSKLGVGLLPRHRREIHVAFRCRGSRADARIGGSWWRECRCYSYADNRSSSEPAHRFFILAFFTTVWVVAKLSHARPAVALVILCIVRCSFSWRRTVGTLVQRVGAHPFYFSPAGLLRRARDAAAWAKEPIEGS